MSTERIALWKPGWYGLDPTIIVGEESAFLFFRDSQGPMANEKRGASLVFYNTTWRRGEAFRASAQIVKIENAELGLIQSVVNNELDYVVTLVDGTVLHVDAEEEPGNILSLDRAIENWSMKVHVANFAVTDPEGLLRSAGSGS